MERERGIAHEKTAAVYDFAIDDSKCAGLGRGSEGVEIGSVVAGEKGDGRGVAAMEGLVTTKDMLGLFDSGCAKYLKVNDEIEKFRN